LKKVIRDLEKIPSDIPLLIISNGTNHAPCIMTSATIKINY